MLHAGSRLASFEILSLLGAGGVGQVWRARDPILGMRKGLEAEGMKDTDFEKIEQSVEKEIEDAVAFAEASPNPPLGAIWEDIVKE